MKPTLVTGATGFVGWHVAKKLRDRGYSVRLLVRDARRLREIDGEPATGDLRDKESVERAVRGCSVVYHVAADYRLWARNPKALYESNVVGTRNLLEAARSAGIERVVYTSTVGCIGMPDDGRPGNEESPVSVNDMTGAYKRSKYLAEQVALDFALSGFPVVIVNPTAPVGDHDFKPTPTGKVVVDFLRRQMPAYVDTGLNVADVRDVAEGHLLACEHGRVGQRYILGSENLTLREIFHELEGLSGVKAPSVQIPYAAAYAAGVLSTAWANLTGREPRAPIDAVRMSRKKMWVVQDKAVRELGYKPGPAHGALRNAVEWFQTNGYVQ